MTDEEMKELEALRLEKHQRTQEARAQAALAQAGVSAAFAALLVGGSDEETDERTARFCAAYQEALVEDVRKRLPQEAPAVLPLEPHRVKRGVRRIR